MYAFTLSIKIEKTSITVNLSDKLLFTKTNDSLIVIQLYTLYSNTSWMKLSCGIPLCVSTIFS